MHDLNDALDELRHVIPYAHSPSVRKLSKIATLLLAKNYILMQNNAINELRQVLLCLHQHAALSLPQPLSASIAALLASLGPIISSTQQSNAAANSSSSFASTTASPATTTTSAGTVANATPGATDYADLNRPGTNQSVGWSPTGGDKSKQTGCEQVASDNNNRQGLMPTNQQPNGLGNSVQNRRRKYNMLINRILNDFASAQQHKQQLQLPVIAQQSSKGAVQPMPAGDRSMLIASASLPPRSKPPVSSGAQVPMPVSCSSAGEAVYNCSTYQPTGGASEAAPAATTAIRFGWERRVEPEMVAAGEAATKGNSNNGSQRYLCCGETAQRGGRPAGDRSQSSTSSSSPSSPVSVGGGDNSNGNGHGSGDSLFDSNAQCNNSSGRERELPKERPSSHLTSNCDLTDSAGRLEPECSTSSSHSSDSLSTGGHCSDAITGGDKSASSGSGRLAAAGERRNLECGPASGNHEVDGQALSPATSSSSQESSPSTYPSSSATETNNAADDMRTQPEVHRHAQLERIIDDDGDDGRRPKRNGRKRAPSIDNPDRSRRLRQQQQQSSVTSEQVQDNDALHDTSSFGSRITW